MADSSRTTVREEGANSGAATVTRLPSTTHVSGDIDSKLSVVLAWGQQLDTEGGDEHADYYSAKNFFG